MQQTHLSVDIIAEQCKTDRFWNVHRYWVNHVERLLSCFSNGAGEIIGVFSFHFTTHFRIPQDVKFPHLYMVWNIRPLFHNLVANILPRYLTRYEENWFRIDSANHIFINKDFLWTINICKNLWWCLSFQTSQCANIFSVHKMNRETLVTEINIDPGNKLW